ncbi:DUF397 domain-containing protein [Streptomyces galbus]|uniref:DUF397 domain-containing protein n=1 Tax=Streptomyces galbus TaxID=33898 RepID=UPI00382C57A7
MRTAAYAQVGSADTGGGTSTVWRKSSHSNPYGDCLEVAYPAGGGVYFHDSKMPSGRVLGVSRAAAAAFFAAAMRGDL